MFKAKKIQLEIPKPCSENWEEMHVVERGRFCDLCQKTVIDFSILSDAEIIAYFKKSKSEVCGRVRASQLHRDLIPAPRQATFSSWKWIAASLLSFQVLTACKSLVSGTKTVEINQTLSHSKTNDTLALNTSANIPEKVDTPELTSTTKNTTIDWQLHPNVNPFNEIRIAGAIPYFPEINPLDWLVTIDFKQFQISLFNYRPVVPRLKLPLVLPPLKHKTVTYYTVASSYTSRLYQAVKSKLFSWLA